LPAEGFLFLQEHELAMRERQMAESKQIELAKLEVAKRMGEESLNEADFARIRRERMKAELLARQSNVNSIPLLGSQNALTSLKFKTFRLNRVTF
jgi:hypothetical protein